MYVYLCVIRNQSESKLQDIVVHDMFYVMVTYPSYAYIHRFIHVYVCEGHAYLYRLMYASGALKLRVMDVMHAYELCILVPFLGRVIARFRLFAVQALVSHSGSESLQGGWIRAARAGSTSVQR